MLLGPSFSLALFLRFVLLIFSFPLSRFASFGNWLAVWHPVSAKEEYHVRGIVWHNCSLVSSFKMSPNGGVAVCASPSRGPSSELPNAKGRTSFQIIAFYGAKPIFRGSRLGKGCQLFLLKGQLSASRWFACSAWGRRGERELGGERDRRSGNLAK